MRLEDRNGELGIHVYSASAPIHEMNNIQPANSDLALQTELG